MKKLKDIWDPKKLVIVFFQNTGDGFELYAISVHAKKGIVAADAFDSLDAVSARFGKYAAYWLHIDGMGVLTRKTDIYSDYKKELILNVDADDFFFTAVNSDVNRIVSFVRKSVAEHLLEQFAAAKLFLLGVSCGFAPVGVLLENEETVSFDYTLAKQNDQFTALERIEIPGLNQFYDGAYLTKKEFLATAIGTAVMTKRADFETFREEAVTAEFREYSKFRIIGVTSIAVIFCVVVSNYFYINYLNNRIADKETEIALNNSNLSMLDKLTQEEIRKRQLATNSNNNTPFFTSYYLDEIGKSVPEKIRLLEMYVFPLTQKLKEKRKVEIDKHRIEVKGWTYDNIILDDWIERLDRQDWIKSIELVNYHQGDGEAEFKIIIFLSE
ncbi:MAG: hypothetical protein KF704_16295 [Crocinitomicaceae bacterium]|nr:hypothetical protein [Crocinitomicaceae bacterium]